MHAPYWLRRVNRYVTNPILGLLAWLVPPFAVVYHVGRKSGRHYRTPIMAFHTTTGLAIVLTYGRDVDWAQNLLTAKGGEIQRLGRRFPVYNPRIVGGDVALPLIRSVMKPLFRVMNPPGYVLLDLAP